MFLLFINAHEKIILNKTAPTQFDTAVIGFVSKPLLIHFGKWINRNIPAFIKIATRGFVRMRIVFKTQPLNTVSSVMPTKKTDPTREEMVIFGIAATFPDNKYPRIL
jgi:hypothetical protein